MKILRCDLQAFGAYTETTFHFKEGWNLMTGPNELGKTTVLHFIEGMLYGFLNPTSKTRRTYPPYERYRRSDGRYQGAMVVEHDGQIYRLERDFNHHALKVFNDATGQDISNRLAHHPVFKHVDCAQMFDLPYPFFKNSVRLTQEELMPDGSAQDYLVSRLQNMEATGSQSLSATKALAYLKDQSDRIRLKTKGQDGPYQRVMQRLEALEDEILEAQTQYDRFLSEEAELNNLRNRLHTLEAEYGIINHQMHAHHLYQNAQEKKQLTDKLKPYGLSFEGFAFHENPQKYVEATTSSERLGLLKSLNVWLQRNDRLSEQPLTSTAVRSFSAEFENNVEQWSMLEKDLMHQQKERERLRFQIDYHHSGLKDLDTEEASLNRPQKPRLRFWMMLLIFPLVRYLGHFLKYQSALKSDLNERRRIEKQRKIKEQHILELNRATHECDGEIERLLNAIEKLKSDHELTFPSALMAQAAYAEAQRQQHNAQSKETLKATWTHERDQAKTVLLPWFHRFALTIESTSCALLLEALTHLDDFERRHGTEIVTLLDTPLDAGQAHADIEALERELTQMKAEKDSVSQTVIQKEARLVAFSERLTDPALLAAQREALESEKDSLEQRLNQIKAAMDLIEKAQERNEDNFAPVLAQTMAHSLAQITGGRYDDLKIRQTLQFKVSDDEGSLKTQAHFSTGTVDQIALAIRLGLLQSLNRLDVPLLLDDAFSMYDDTRLEQALKHITSLGFKQVLCFSAQRRESELLEKANIPFHPLTKEGPAHAKR